MEQISYVGEMDPNCELWEVVSKAIGGLKTEVISQSAPYLVSEYRREVEKILEENQKSKRGGLADFKIEVLEKWLELSEGSSGFEHDGGPDDLEEFDKKWMYQLHRLDSITQEKRSRRQSKGKT